MSTWFRNAPICKLAILLSRDSALFLAQGKILFWIVNPYYGLSNVSALLSSKKYLERLTYNSGLGNRRELFPCIKCSIGVGKGKSANVLT